MANSELLRFIKENPSSLMQWRTSHQGVGFDLGGADLSGLTLSRISFSQADLLGANLSGVKAHQTCFAGAHLGRADLTGADLSGAEFDAAILRSANFTGANLKGAHFLGANLTMTDLTMADLSNADLRDANLRGANLTNTNLTGAVVDATIFVDNDLRSTKGLETLHHVGPSYVGIDTILASAGQIPEIFLRGVGLPDNFIVYVRSLVGKPIEFDSSFISYSTEDQEFVDRLYTDLQANGVRCWFAPQDVQGGKKLYEQIDEAIHLHDRLLLILSAASMGSKWVKTEIATARKREDEEQRRLLFPIRIVNFELIRDWKCFNADIGTDSAAEIREFFIPDFSRWKDHDLYQQAFERLLRDLKAESQK